MPTLSPASDPLAGTLVPLETGGFVRLNLTGQQITLDRFDATGLLTTSAVPVSTTPSGRTTKEIGALALQDGSAGVWWVQHDAALDNDRLLFKQVANDGTLGPAQVTATANATADVTYDNVHAALLTSGQVVLSADRVDQGSGSYLTFTTRVTPGQATGADLTTVVSRGDIYEASSGLVALKGGGYVVTYATGTAVPGRYATSDATDIQWYAVNSFARVYDNLGHAGGTIALGTTYQPEFLGLFPDDSKNQTGMIVATEDGGFAVVKAASHLSFAYRDVFGDNHYQNVGDGVRVGVYDATGSLRNTVDVPASYELTVAAGTRDGYGQPVRDVGTFASGFLQLVELRNSDAAFLLVRQNYGSQDLSYSFASAGGTAFETPKDVSVGASTVYTGTYATLDYIDGVQLPDGRIFFQGIGANGQHVGRIFDPRGDGVHIVGTAADESYIGTIFNDTLEGGGGFDTLNGGRGDDILSLGPVITGGRFDFSRNFVVDGGAGDDTIDLTAFHYTGAGSGSQSTREIGPDFFIDLASGEARVDKVLVGLATGFEKLQLSFGNDVVIAGNDGATVDGGGGNDKLVGGTLADFLSGDDGNDTLSGGLGNDTLDGGVGHNVLDYSASAAGVRIDLTVGIVSGEGVDRISNFDEVVGSHGADRLIAGDNAATLQGGEGSDTILGGGGDDLILGLEAPPTAFFETGSILRSEVFEGLADGPNSILGGDGNDTIVGGSGNDTIDAGSGANVVYAGGGDDYVISQGPGRDAAFIASSSDVRGGSGSDTLEGGSGFIDLYGDEGDDLLSYTTWQVRRPAPQWMPTAGLEGTRLI